MPLTARTYRHPGLDDRVVVRLVAGELGAAEDLAAGVPRPGAGRRSRPSSGWACGSRWASPSGCWCTTRRTGTTRWPSCRSWSGRPGRRSPSRRPALDAYQELGERLAASVPHFLPTFYEQAGRVFLAVENATYAAQMFTRARKAEAEHGLTVDEERLDAVFLEFALAGALPVKVLSGVREGAGRAGARPRRRCGASRRLCLRRTAGGLPPSAQMAGDLRRLARAAGPGRGRRPSRTTWPSCWSCRPRCAPRRAGGRPTARRWWRWPCASREVRGHPAGPDARTSDDDEMPALWLEILEASGATAGLWRRRPARGAAAARRHGGLAGAVPDVPGAGAVLARLHPHA